MKALRSFLDKIEPQFTKGGKLEKLYPLYEAADTFLYTPGLVTKGKTHVRDGMDLKRMMITVAVALGPCVLMALLNTGYQANLAMSNMGMDTIDGWRGWVMGLLGMGYDPGNIIDNIVHGALYFVPIFLVTQIAGGTMEVIFSVVRKHEVNEGFLVTGMLYPLTLPPDTPLWQVAIGIMFGVVFAKEIFGGTGKNFLNVALTARAFLFFAYPAQLSGDAVWVAVDGYTGATALGAAAAGGMAALGEGFSWFQSFVGFIPGSLGETSALAAVMGAGILIVSGVGSWRIMLSMLLSFALIITLFNVIGSETNPMFEIPIWWHLVIGSFAFGMVFMATDPVTAAYTDKAKWAYGALIGVMVALVRVVNPAFPEGVFLAILFANTFSPLLDYFVIKANITRRKLRHV